MAAKGSMTSNAVDLSARLEFAYQLARAAGDLTLGYFRQQLQVERKADGSPVTVADREAELFLRRELTDNFPEDGIVGEEFPEKPGTSGLRWILDPIDGTKSFVSGVPLYGTMVALEQDGRGILGVIHIPALDETVFAASGQGAWHVSPQPAPPLPKNASPTPAAPTSSNAGTMRLVRRPARVTASTDLAEGLVLTSEIRVFEDRQARAGWDQLTQRAWLSRTWGDCYGYLLVATGRAAVMVDAGLNVWDAAAVQPILAEAGGIFTDWSGQPSIHSGEGIGTSPALLPAVLECLRPFARPSP